MKREFRTNDYCSISSLAGDGLAFFSVDVQSRKDEAYSTVFGGSTLDILSDPKYEQGKTLLRTLPVLAQLGYSLEQYRQTMLCEGITESAIALSPHCNGFKLFPANCQTIMIAVKWHLRPYRAVCHLPFGRICSGIHHRKSSFHVGNWHGAYHGHVPQSAWGFLLRFCIHNR